MEGPPCNPALIDPERWVEEHGDCLYGFALARVRKPEVAEDLVQETLIAAFKARDRFQGRSKERSWLVGILKNKIVDHYRKLGREQNFTDLAFFSDEQGGKFQDDFWIHELGPQEWRKSDEVEHREDFWKTLRDCMGKLPPKVAAVFMLRELDGLGTEEICATLLLSQSNLWVMLHRARMALRQCLESNWFEKAPEQR
jgi:RNA polymerase sigma-70 factor (ECF subfamily)